MSEQQVPTWAEKSALQRLIGQGRLAAIVAGDLVPLYVRRGYAEGPARRCASNVLGRLHRKGFVRETLPSKYAITRSGKRAAQ